MSVREWILLYKWEWVSTLSCWTLAAVITWHNGFNIRRTEIRTVREAGFCDSILLPAKTCTIEIIASEDRKQLLGWCLEMGWDKGAHLLALVGRECGACWGALPPRDICFRSRDHLRSPISFFGGGSPSASFSGQGGCSATWPALHPPTAQQPPSTPLYELDTPSLLNTCVDICRLPATYLAQHTS